MTTVKWPCGCELPIKGNPGSDMVINVNFGDTLPKGIQLDVYNMNLKCEATWDMICSGRTKGVFQLESPLGRQWSKKLEPRSIEELGALGALLRPGCISGDTMITHRIGQREGRKHDFKKIRIRELFELFHRGNGGRHIISLDENTNTFIKNNVVDIMYSGKQDVYIPSFRCVDRKHETGTRFYSLECTLNHPLLTTEGWKKLEDIELGERIAVVTSIKKQRTETKNAPGEKHFRHICFQNYEYKCVFCDWSEGSLDVNHIEGNR